MSLHTHTHTCQYKLLTFMGAVIKFCYDFFFLLFYLMRIFQLLHECVCKMKTCVLVVALMSGARTYEYILFLESYKSKNYVDLEIRTKSRIK